MNTITVFREIDAPAEKVWEVIDNYGNIAIFHPFLESTEIINDIETGMGATRVNYFYDGNSVKETIIRYDIGRGYTCTLEEFSVPWEKSFFNLDVVPLGESKSIARLSIEFVPKFGELGLAMAPVTTEPLTDWWIHQVLEGLNTYVTTGKEVGEKSVLLNLFLWGLLWSWFPDFTPTAS